MVKVKIFILMILLAGVTACKKSQSDNVDNSNTTPALLKILKSRTWKPALVDKTPNLKPPGTSTYYAVLNCRLDDVFTFGDNNALTINSGTDRCNGSQPITELNDYKYDESKNQLSLDIIQYTILEITPDQIKIYSQSSTGALIFLFQ